MRHFLLYLLAWLLMASPAQAEDGWLHHFETAQNIAQNDHRLILVDFWASWCGPCLKMDAQVWSDSAVQAQKAKFVPLKIDVDLDPTLTSHYRVNAMPTLMILDSYGEILYRHKGYMDQRAVSDLLSSFPASVASINQLHQQVSINSQSPYLNFMVASAYQKYGEVLEKEGQRAFLARSDDYYRQCIRQSRAEKDTLLNEKARLFHSLNDVLRGHPKRSIKTIEKKITLQHVHVENLPVAYYVLARACLQLQKTREAAHYYQALSQTTGSAYYQKALAKSFQEKSSLD